MPEVIPFETTTVPPEKTAAEIEKMLQEAGALSAAKQFEAGKIRSMFFKIATPEGIFPFRLPVETAGVYQLMYDRKKAMDIYRYGVPKAVEVKVHAQAERTAWRLIHWWVKAQLGLIQAQMVEVQQVFLPYMLVGADTTLYEKLQAGGFKALGPGHDI